MYKDFQLFRSYWTFIAISVLAGVTLLTLANVSVAYGQSSSSDELVYKELVAIYETNLIRRENGLAPLRWNRELSEAAREFARDTIVVRDTPYCGHTDSQGRDVLGRIEAAGYSPNRWAENAACGYLEPEVVVPSWFESDSHRHNMLIPEIREIGVGYYLDGPTGNGYVVQKFAHDRIVAPIIINNEAPTTESTEVSLYIYDSEPRGGFNGIGSAVEMMISNSPHFENAQWEPYAVEKNWFLESGTGWRYVFVKKRDSVGRVTTAFDAIYLGATMPAGELTLDFASSVEREMTYDNIVEQFPQAQNWSSIQMGRYWAIDDNTESFSLFNDSGIQVDDPDALGGTAYQLNLSRYDASYLGENATLAAAWAGDAPANTPLVAYIRAKVDDNSKADRTLKIWAESGTTQFDPITIRSNEFLYPGIYQEFAIPLEFINPNPGDLLAIRVYHYGGNDVWLDTVSFFAAEQPFSQSASWSSTDQSLRDRGFIARVTESGDSDTIYEVGEQIISSGTQNPQPQPTAQPATPTPTPTQSAGGTGITLSINDLEFEASVSGTTPELVEIDVECSGCGEEQWWVYSNKSWLTAYRFFNDIYVQVDQANLSPGTYEGQATVGAPSSTGIPIQQITVRFTVTDSGPTPTTDPATDPDVGGNNNPPATPPATPTPQPTPKPPSTPKPTLTPTQPTATPTQPAREPTPSGSNQPNPTTTAEPTETIGPGNFTNQVFLPVTAR